MVKRKTIKKRPAGNGKPKAPARPLSIDGNRLTLLPDGPMRLDALVELIDSAQASLRLLYYTFLADASGERVKEALFRAIDRGVDVALLIDGFGSSATPGRLFRRPVGKRREVLPLQSDPMAGVICSEIIRSSHWPTATRSNAGRSSEGSMSPTTISARSRRAHGGTSA